MPRLEAKHEAMLRARVEQYYDRNPELADWMETNLPEGFTVFRFARSTWRRIRTNNGLDLARIMQEP